MPQPIVLEARRPSARRPVAGIGRVLLWHGGGLWIGRDAGRAELHAHHAVQISLALDARFLMRERDGVWREYAGAIVMPHHPHQFDGCGRSMAHVFVEPETAQGRLLIAQHGASGIADLAADIVEALVQSLREAYTTQADDEALIAMAQRAIATLTGPLPAAEATDPRIVRVIDWLRQRLDAPISLKDAAEIAHLSPSRFRHLFVAQTGVSFRAYLLWARVQAAVGAAMGGQSWTAAAQDAGFADSAHLSRTCRRMLGIAPATLLRE